MAHRRDHSRVCDMGDKMRTFQYLVSVDVADSPAMTSEHVLALLKADIGTYGYTTAQRGVHLATVVEVVSARHDTHHDLSFDVKCGG